MKRETFVKSLIVLAANPKTVERFGIQCKMLYIKVHKDFLKDENKKEASRLLQKHMRRCNIFRDKVHCIETGYDGADFANNHYTVVITQRWRSVQQELEKSHSY